VVQLFLVRANKLAFLIGGMNAILYGIGYFDESLYFSAFNAVAISAPIQFFSYFNWRRKINKGKEYLCTLNVWMRLIVIALCILGWIFCFKYLDNCLPFGRFVGADSFIFILGLIVPVLSAFGYVDSQYLSVVSCLASLGMWIAITIEEPQNINYVLISLYNLFRVTEAAISWTLIYKRNTIHKINT
jgi:nicotinamide riboside transporter PnuC